MKVMLIQLPHFYDGTARPPTLYPLGLGYLASILKKDHEPVPMDLWIGGMSVDRALREIGKSPPDAFGISVYSTQYPYFKELVAGLKDRWPRIPIVAGGPGATFSYRTMLERTMTDFCVIGEGEITLAELLGRMEDPGSVAGIAYRGSEGIRLTSPRAQIADLDGLPLPDRDFFDIGHYIENCRKEDGGLHGLRATNVIAGRGCPYHCAFCSRTFQGIRLRSVAKIDEEIGLLVSRYGMTGLEFNDELMVINRDRVLGLCGALRKYGIRWGCQGRINLMNREILDAMKEAGCLYVGYGVESWTPSILSSMKKMIKVEDAVPVIEMTRKAGIRPIVQYMYGFPGEDRVSIERTYDFFAQIDHPFVGFTTTPLPGTDIYETAMRKGLIVDEEEYLNRLTGGYNLWKPLVNLTDFSDDEFSSLKMDLMRRINRRYYRRHPILWLGSVFRNLSALGGILVRDPGLFFRKAGAKLAKTIRGIAVKKDRRFSQ